MFSSTLNIIHCVLQTGPNPIKLSQKFRKYPTTDKDTNRHFAYIKVRTKIIALQEFFRVLFFGQ